MQIAVNCPNCSGTNLYVSEAVPSGGGYAPNYLPGTGSFWGLNSATFYIVVCVDCGLTRFFADDGAVGRIPNLPSWHKL